MAGGGRKRMFRGQGLLGAAALLLCAASARITSGAGAAAAGPDTGAVFSRQAYVTLVTTPEHVIGVQTLDKVGMHTHTHTHTHTHNLSLSLFL